MTTPPDFGGREIEEGVEEDLGAHLEEHQAGHPLDEGGSDYWEGNEAHAPGKTCERCGAVIAPGEDARRRPDGHWVHEICPSPAG
jgi:hypothetical protein